MNCKIQNTRKSILDFLFIDLQGLCENMLRPFKAFRYVLKSVAIFSWQKINVFHLSFDLQLSSFHVRAWFAGIKADGVGEGGCYERTIRSAKFFGMAMKV